MLDLQIIRENPQLVKKGMQDKNMGTPEVVDVLIEIDEERRMLLTTLQQEQMQANQIAKEIGVLMKQGKREEAQEIIKQTHLLKEQIKQREDELRVIEEKQSFLLLEIPNIPHDSVPIGKTPNENVVDGTWGQKPTFDFVAKPHWELVAQHDLVDFDRGSKVTGAGFPFYKGKGAKLQRALINFFLDEATNAGYTEFQAPLMINEASGIGTGQLPDKEGQMYEIQNDRFFMIPTAEVPVTNYHRDEILEQEQLPLQYCAYTPCFRREAGSYGKDVRGLNRLHQFDKVELVQFVLPETSYDVLEAMREHAESLLQKLELPYHRLLMCTGDLGFTQTKKYDLEVWSAAQERWLEVSSISNFETFQARRANIKFRGENNKPHFVHTLNGSGLALPRVVAAILENNQTASGAIHIPEVLQPYTGFSTI